MAMFDRNFEFMADNLKIYKNKLVLLNPVRIAYNFIVI